MIKKLENADMLRTEKRSELFPAVLAKPCRGSLCASVSSFVKKEGNYTIFAHPSESLCLSDDIPCLREYLNESGYH